MAKKEAAAEVASLNPDEMLAGGLKDDFRGKIVGAAYCRWDYDGNIDEPVLGAKLTIEVEDEDEPFEQVWSAGDLAAFVPSQDGKTPCEEDEEGPYAVRVGKRAQLNNNTNFAHLMTAIIDAGEASKKFTRKNLTASLECLVGLDAHWNRVPQKKRSGLATAEGETQRARDVLVVTEVFGYGESKGKPNGKAGKPVVKSKKEEEEVKADEQEETPDDKLQTVILEALDEAGGTLKKGKLATIVLKAMAKDKDKSKAVKRCTEIDFLGDSDRPWTFDEDEGTISTE